MRASGQSAFQRGLSRSIRLGEALEALYERGKIRAEVSLPFESSTCIFKHDVHMLRRDDFNLEVNTMGYATPARRGLDSLEQPQVLASSRP